MRKNRTVIILDRSGSMSSCHTGTVKGFNEQVQEAKKVKADLDVDIGLVQFNGEVEFTIWGKKPDEISELTNADYRPNGSTALRDAVGFSIDRLVDEAKNYPEDSSYLVIIISDGEENASKHVEAKMLAERIQELQNTKKWTFTYMGANFDLAKIAAEMNIPMGNIMKFTADESHVRASNAVRSRSTEGYYAALGNNMHGGAVSSFYAPSGKMLDLTQPVDAASGLPLLEVTKTDEKSKKSDTPSKKA